MFEDIVKEECVSEVCGIDIIECWDMFKESLVSYYRAVQGRPLMDENEAFELSQRLSNIMLDDLTKLFIKEIKSDN